MTSKGKIYFVSASFSGAGAVKVMDADGSNEITLVEGADVIEPDGLEVDVAGGKMYWTDMGIGGAADKSPGANDGRIMRADLDGKNIETLVPLGVTTTPKQLALDVPGGKIYWCDRGDVGEWRVNPKVMRSNLDGSSVETIISADVRSPVGIALDTPNGKLYFTDRYLNKIRRANLDGTDVEVVVRDTAYPVDLALDLDKRVMYWTAREAGAVFRSELDGNDIDGASLQPIVTGLHAPIGVALHPGNGRILYTDVIIPTKSGAIWESDPDGRNAKQISGTPMPLGLCFVS
jgi:DNA-binding beta-propeller fold protein YncE